MRLPSLSPDEIATFAGDLDDHEVRDPADPRRGAWRRADPDRRAHRQQRGDRRAHRPARAADQRGRRRQLVPGAVRAAPRPARGMGRHAHPVAQPARDLRRPAPARDARPADRLGLPQRRDPGPPVRRVDDACRPGRRRWPPRPGRASCRSRSIGTATASSRSRCRRRSTSPRPTRPSSSGRARRWPTRWPTPSAARPSSGTASSRCGRPAPPKGTTSSAAPGSCRPASPTRARSRAAARRGRRGRRGTRCHGGSADAAEAAAEPAEAAP